MKKLPTALKGKKLLCVRVDKTYLGAQLPLFDAARFAWRVNKMRAEQQHYIVAIAEGKIQGFFTATAWLPADNKPAFGTISTFNSPKNQGRYGFTGKEIADRWAKELVGQSVTVLGYQKSRNPVQYIEL